MGRRTARRNRIGTAAAALAAGAMVAGLTVQTSLAAFNGVADNPSSDWATGVVSLADDDGGTAMFDVAALKPGDVSTRCIEVEYTGTLDSDVKVYGSVSGTLGGHLDLQVEVGSGGSFADCAGFTPQLGSPIWTSATLASFGATHADWASGLDVGWDPSGPDELGNTETRTFRFTTTVADDPAAEGTTATATFTWEAQNL